MAISVSSKMSHILKSKFCSLMLFFYLDISTVRYPSELQANMYIYQLLYRTAAFCTCCIRRKLEINLMDPPTEGKGVCFCQVHLEKPLKWNVSSTPTHSISINYIINYLLITSKCKMLKHFLPRWWLH